MTIELNANICVCFKLDERDKFGLESRLRPCRKKTIIENLLPNRLTAAPPAAAVARQYISRHRAPRHLAIPILLGQFTVKACINRSLN